MAKLSKKIKKNTKKLEKRAFGKKSLTLKQNFSVTTSFYSHGKDSKPYVTLSANGDYRISVAKLILIALGIITAFSLLALALKSLSDFLRRKKTKKTDEDELFYMPDEDGIPF